MNNNIARVAFRGSQKTILSRAFLTAGIIFLGVFLLGILTWVFIDRQGDIKAQIQNAAGQNPSEVLTLDGPFRRLAIIFFIGAGLSLVSFILTMIWNFRFTKSSFTFAYTVLGVYTAAQGVGFGIMFTIFQLQDIIYAFGAAGAIFITMATIGFFVKDASTLLPWIIGLTIVEMVASIVFIALYFVGIFSSTFYLWLTIGSVLVSGLYIIYTVWRLRKMDEWSQAGGQIDEDYRKRLVLFFGFILATQLIQLIWLMLRLLQYMKR